MKRLIPILFVLLISTPAAHAIDPGRAQGTLQINGEKVALKEAYAHYHDNTERLLDRPKEIRIVLSDRRIPQESLRGIAFLPVTDLAREGLVEGLLLQFDPGDRSKMLVTLLRKPPRTGLSLMTLSLVETNPPLLKKISISKTRISGELKYADTRQTGSEGLPQLSYTVTFSAPLFHELPVTADLRGRKAQESPQIKVMRQKVEALKKGDMEGIKQVSSEKANRRNAAIMEKMDSKSVQAFAKEGAVELEKTVKTVTRVVVRDDSAVAICSGGKTWMIFVKEGGSWKSDD
jgi:hypothetical protein